MYLSQDSSGNKPHTHYCTTQPYVMHPESLKTPQSLLIIFKPGIRNVDNVLSYLLIFVKFLRV